MPPDELVIRPYAEADEARVIALWRTLFPGDYPDEVPRAEIRRKLAVQPELFLVGELGGRVVATVMAGFDGHRGWLHLVGVAPDCRRRGIARAIVRDAERRLGELGCAKVNLHVRPGNEGARALYAELGYEAEPDICMGKHLGRDETSR